MLDPNLTWEIRSEGEPTGGTVGEPSPYSFRERDIHWWVRVPTAEIGEFLELSAANDYDEITRRWGVTPDARTISE